MSYLVMALIFLLPSLMKFADSKMLTGSPAFERSHHFNQQRLPLTIFPTLYRINLFVPLANNNFTITGEEWIYLNCSMTTREVVFHVKNIDIDKTSTKVYDPDNNLFILITEQRYESSREMFMVKTAVPLISGRQYELYLHFSYILNDELMGFYRSSYIDHDTGEKHWLATTQFSPTAARRAFPCWDEPSFKARFAISIAHPKQYHALSNMPISMSIPTPGMDNWIFDIYQTTLPMSTYLVAFIVSDFVPYQTVIDNSSGWKFTLWSRKDILSQTEYAAGMGPKLLTYLEDYFCMKFPLPKQDVVAIPDFGFSAMENWGLITFRESSLLFVPGKTSQKVKLDIAFVFGHELAHQWFGNLVTPAWWNDLWLKEGFATFIGYKALNHIEPSWKVLDQFLLQQVLGSMKIDSLNSTHQIEVEVEEPKDIVQIFDNISYMKGASIINMMSHFLGENAFRAGLKRYLEEHKYSNACQDQLWQAITSQAASRLPEGVTVKDIMDTWTLQSGFPVVSVHRDYCNGSATIEQERYFLLSDYFSSTDKWWVPVSYTTQSEKDFNNTQPKVWLNPSKSTKKITNIGADDWLLINLKHTGYYKVNYDGENWLRLQNSYLEMPETIRAQLLSDVFSLAATGRTNYSIALGFSLHLSKDNSYFPWSIASEKLSFIGKLMRDTSSYEDLKAYLLHLVVNTNKELTFFPKTPITDHLNLLLQINLVGLAADSGYKKLVDEAKQFLADEILGKNVSIMADFKSKAYCTAIKHGGVKEWQFVWKKYLESNIASDRVILLMALGCSRNSTIITKYLNWILDPGSEIRKQDGGFVFEVVANKNPVLAFNFLKERWEDLQAYFGLGFRQMAKMIESLGAHLNMEQQLIEIEKLRADHMESLGSTSNSFKQTIERIRFNIQWMKHHYDSVRLWLKDMLPKLKKS